MYLAAIRRCIQHVLFERAIFSMSCPCSQFKGDLFEGVLYSPLACPCLFEGVLYVFSMSAIRRCPVLYSACPVFSYSKVSCIQHVR